MAPPNGWLIMLGLWVMYAAVFLAMRQILTLATRVAEQREALANLDRRVEELRADCDLRFRRLDHLTQLLGMGPPLRRSEDNREEV